MNIRVIYHSATGNTEKLANIIADLLKIKAERIGEGSEAFLEPVDLLFIGDGIYFGKPSKKVCSFIDRLDPKMIKNAVVFATCGGQTTIGADLSKLLQEKSIKIIEEPFVCKGQSWLFLNRKHPDSSDLNKIREYTNNIRSKMKN